MAAMTTSSMLRVAALAFLFSLGILLQLLACVLYSNWWPLLSCIMYILVPMPCLFFNNGSATDFISMNDDWEDGAKFLTGFSTIGSVGIPVILYHAGYIQAGAMVMEFFSFAVLVLTAFLFQRSSYDDDW